MSSKPWEKYKKPEKVAKKPWEKFTKAEEVAPKEEDKVTQEQRVDFLTRLGLKNILGEDKDLQQEYLKKKGFETRLVDDQVQVKKPGEKTWGVVDPEGFDLQDVTDLAGDALEAAIAGASSLAGGLLAGPVGALGGGAVGTGLTETARQKVAQELGMREEYDPSRIGIKTALAGAIPAAVGGAGLAGKALRGAGKAAAGRAMKLGQGKVAKLGPKKVREIGEIAAEEGLLDVFTGSEAAADKAQAKLAELGKGLASKYKKLDEKVITRIPVDDLIGGLSDQSTKNFPDPRHAKTLQRELRNILSTKKELKPSDLWQLATELEKQAGTHTKITTGNAAVKAQVLGDSAKKIRDPLAQMAKSRGMDDIIEDSHKYGTIKTAYDGIYKRAAGIQAGTKPPTEELLEGARHLGEKAVAKTGLGLGKLVPEVGEKSLAGAAATGALSDRIETAAGSMSLGEKDSEEEDKKLKKDKKPIARPGRSLWR